MVQVIVPPAEVLDKPLAEPHDTAELSPTEVEYHAATDDNPTASDAEYDTATEVPDM
jgi:hypothetical protein